MFELTVSDLYYETEIYLVMSLAAGKNRSDPGGATQFYQNFQKGQGAPN